MHAVVSGTSDVAKRQVRLGELSGEGFRKFMSGQQGSGVRRNGTNVSLESVNITPTHSSIHRSPPPDQHSTSCTFAAAT